MKNIAVKTALISVADKTGIVELAVLLHQQQIKILATGGSAKLLQQHGIPITEVSEYTGSPEILNGRVKTLHPKVHAGILYRRDNSEDLQTIQQLDIASIDLLIVNLYPFKQVITKFPDNLELAIENIDIGGPTMIRAAAKNYQAVIVVVDNQDYSSIGEKIIDNKLDLDTRFQLARKAFSYIAQYDICIANYFYQEDNSEFPAILTNQLVKQTDLRYGENSQQSAAIYQNVLTSKLQASLLNAQQYQGKQLSYNNMLDADTAWRCVQQFKQPACVIVKHANPCGVAIAENLSKAYVKAYQSDSISAFGGIIAFNRELDKATAQNILSQQFVEVIIAPKVSKDALALLLDKPNIRVLAIKLGDQASQINNNFWEFKSIGQDGLLVQSTDNLPLNPEQLTCVTKSAPSETLLADLLFAEQVVKFVKSNAIVYVRDQQILGIGAGQMNRLASVEIGANNAANAGFKLAGSVMASDAFFPFRDGIDKAAAAGVTAIIQPGGSLRDQEVIDAANEYNISMLFTGVRRFRH